MSCNNMHSSFYIEGTVFPRVQVEPITMHGLYVSLVYHNLQGLGNACIYLQIDRLLLLLITTYSCGATRNIWFDQVKAMEAYSSLVYKHFTVAYI